MTTYIYQHKNWPHFTWDHERLLPILGNVRNLQGKLVGKMESLGFSLRDEAILLTLTQDVLKSSAIEGEMLDPEQVRSSIAKKLGMDISGLIDSDRNVDGVVDMTMDAVQNYNDPLTTERLFGWHSALFPEGRSGIYRIIAGNWRNDSTGPMQVVSGPMGKENVHFEAPKASVIPSEIDAFLDFVNTPEKTDPVMKAGLVHLWFVTIHPFDDGNGRIARAITDMLLARSDGSSQRFYSLSAQIRQNRKKYYNVLEKTQRGTPEVTEWLEWFLNSLSDALNYSDKTLARVIDKANFWKIHEMLSLNDRQKLMLNKLLDGFDGKLTTTKWAKIAKCSADTSLRDIQDLMSKEILRKTPAGGRSTSYDIVIQPNN